MRNGSLSDGEMSSAYLQGSSVDQEITLERNNGEL